MVAEREREGERWKNDMGERRWVGETEIKRS